MCQLMNDQELINQLSQASAGLLWLSESDYPFEIVYLDHVNDLKSKLLELTDCDSEERIEIREFDRFFQRVTDEEDCDDEEEMAECKRYQALVKLLQTHLTEIKVYRVGSCEVNVYILGKTTKNAIAGLSTISIET